METATVFKQGGDVMEWMTAEMDRMRIIVTKIPASLIKSSLVIVASVSMLCGDVMGSWIVMMDRMRR